MSKNIKMYNAYFGDCFVIEDFSSNMVVDFGIRKCSIPIVTTVDVMLDLIARDLRLYNNRSLLITHFHYDHISGLTKLLHDHSSLLFDTVYIPNIWRSPFVIASNLAQQGILKSLLASKHVPGYSSGSISLFDLLIYLCNNVSHINLLRRGDIFEEGKYITLLPDDRILDKINMKYREEKIPDILRDFIDEITNLAEEVSLFFEDESMLRFVSNYRYQMVRSLINYREKYDSIVNKVDINTLNPEKMEAVLNLYKKLDENNNEISIVFQNHENSQENLLFTGDADSTDLERISTMTDIPMHEHYKYIKVPHHGTDSHYYDFSSYTPEWILIPSGKTPYTGKILSSGKIGYNDKISSKYGNVGTNKMCSNSNHCDNCLSGCKGTITCTSSRNIVFPYLYKVV